MRVRAEAAPVVEVEGVVRLVDGINDTLASVLAHDLALRLQDLAAVILLGVRLRRGIAKSLELNDVVARERVVDVQLADLGSPLELGEEIRNGNAVGADRVCPVEDFQSGNSLSSVVLKAY